MLGGGNPGKSGGVWMPDFGDVPKPGLGCEEEEELDKEFEGWEE
jgi:hypothetical protein